MNKFKIGIIAALFLFVLISGACNLPFLAARSQNTPEVSNLYTLVANTLTAQTQQALQTQIPEGQATQPYTSATVNPTSQATETEQNPTETQPAPYSTPVPPTPIPTPCNWAAFIQDISVPDGADFFPYTTFTKPGACKT